MSDGKMCCGLEKPICAPDSFEFKPCMVAFGSNVIFASLASSSQPLRFSQCELCFHFKRDLASAKNIEEKLGTLIEYRRHLAEQYQDRSLLWMLQEASLDSMSDVLVCQIDGMNQGKFRLPRDPGLRCTASLHLDLSL